MDDVAEEPPKNQKPQNSIPASMPSINGTQASSINMFDIDIRPFFKNIFRLYVRRLLIGIPSGMFILTFIYYIYLLVGMVSFYFLRHQMSGNKTNGFLDGFYFTVVLGTSIGYGELTPDSTLTILLTTIFAIAGVLLIGGLMSLQAESFDMQRELIDKSKKYRSIVIKTNFMFPFVWLVFHMAIGILVLVAIGDIDYIHAFYCINSTIATVVGSDKCFSTKNERVFAIFWIINGMGIMSVVLLNITKLISQKRQRSFVKKAGIRKMTLADLQTIHLDEDGVVGLAGYILLKLIDIGKLSRQDTEPIIQEYGHAAHQTATGNQTSSIIPPKPSFDRERNVVDYFPWLPTSWQNILITILVLSTYVVLGATTFYFVRHHISGIKTNNIVDAVFFTIIIMTSVGYGDLSPDGTLAILLATFFALVGMLLIGLVLGMVIERLVDQKELPDKTVPKKRHLKLRKNKECKKAIIKIVLIVVLFLVHMVVGTTILVAVEDLDVIHAGYCIGVTITSAGNETCFSTTRGRVFALFWILLGTIYKGHVLYTFTELYTRRKQRLVAKRKATTDMEEAGVNDGDDNVLSRTEYILYKLIHTKSFGRDDVVPIIQEFQKLDVDDTGKLSLREIMPNQQ